VRLGGSGNPSRWHTAKSHIVAKLLIGCAHDTDTTGFFTPVSVFAAWLHGMAWPVTSAVFAPVF
jgi:hypothetical protein